MSLTHQFSHFLSYRKKAAGAHSLHSPFVFELYNKVIQAKEVPSDQRIIESQRKKLLRDHTLIPFDDHGAGSRRSGKQQTRKISEIARSSLKSRKEASLLYRLVMYMQPDLILELGTSLGISAAYLSSRDKSNLITVEGDPTVATIASEWLREMNRSNVTVVHDTFRHYLNNDQPDADLAFIDGDHTYEGTMWYAEYFLSKPHIPDLLVFDDIYWSAGMTRAWKELCERKEFITIDLFRLGLLFPKRDQEPEHFVLKF